MSDLIEALKIFHKYEDHRYPTACEHDALYVHVAPSMVNERDVRRLEELSFVDSGYESFVSYRYG